MQVQELLRLTIWFEEEVIQRELPSKYSNLFNKLNHNANRNNNQPAKPFEEERDKLYNTLRSISLDPLSLEQISFLNSLEIDDLITDTAVDLIDDILTYNVIDIATAAKRVQEFSSRLNDAQTRISSIRNTLSESFEVDDKDEIPEDSVMMRIYFKEKVSIDSLKSFKKLSAEWYDIGRGIAMAKGMSPEDFKVVGALKGSVIIDLAVVVGLAKSVSFILLRSLKVAERFIEVLLKVEELKAMKLKNKAAEEALLQEADVIRNEGTKSILEGCIKELKLNKKSDGDKITALKKSIDKLLNFTNNGGVVDIVQPEEDEQDVDQENDSNLRREVERLKSDMSEIRKLENKIKLLEEKNKKGG